MLFNSYLFIFIFLPVTLLFFFYSAKYSHSTALGVLLVSSLIFYGWNNSFNVLLLLVSIIINFLISKLIIKTASTGTRKLYLWVGIFFNISLLGFFKYTNFLIQNANFIFHSQMEVLNIALPIGISFFTFTQIAFIVDCYRGFIKKYRFQNYVLFVTYFPHLIAGPIIHHKTVMPQFEKKRTFNFNYRNFTLGLFLFTIGMFKKTVLADYLSVSVSPVFDMQVVDLSSVEAWIAALSYTFELYFDFSGYSDMALGLSLLIGIKLPVNFFSPYQSQNIVDFWRRWNITLSHFLRDYLYIPLGGNRKGIMMRYINLMITMLLGGLWHGAGWAFIFWGFLHGFYLCINHGWHAIKKYLGFKTNHSRITKILSIFATFLLVVIAWVFFRSPDFFKACSILNAMFNLNFTAVPKSGVGLHLLSSGSVIFISAIIVWVFPNSYQILRKYRPALFLNDKYLTSRKNLQWQWKPTFSWNIITVFIFTLAVVNIQASSIFLYFRF